MSAGRLPRPEVWRGRRVLVTGHTGFKGAWLSLWLVRLGAEVHGFSQGPLPGRSLFVDARLHEVVRDHRGDVRDERAVREAVAAAAPDLVLHLAARSLVRAAYRDPVATYATNAMGTVHVLEAARGAGRPVVVVTSDKCYENRERDRGYREGDALGGRDPYAASKACAEIAASSYARAYPGAAFRVATARAGNVVGGGDWAPDRLVPDLVRGLLTGRTVGLRHPDAVRPWQHVLEPLGGYLLLGERLLAGDLDGEAGIGWNFGPGAADEVSVREVADEVCRLWGCPSGWRPELEPGAPHEAVLLRLDAARARRELDWRPRWGLARALAASVAVYRSGREGAALRALMEEQIAAYAEPKQDGSLNSSRPVQ